MASADGACEWPALPLLRTILETAPQTAREWFWNPESYRPYVDIEFALLQMLWQARTPALLELFLHWIAAQPWASLLFFWQPGHCEAAYLSEQRRKQMPPALRN